MSEIDRSANLKPNTLMDCEESSGVERKSVSSLQVIDARPLPLRIAVIGNHLPRQCGIATFTTDLCDAIAGSTAPQQCS